MRAMRVGQQLAISRLGPPCAHSTLLPEHHNSVRAHLYPNSYLDYRVCDDLSKMRSS